MLSKEQIIKHLDSIHEHTMARDIFVPVLKTMGLQGVKFTGGSHEQGIDIEYFELTQPENSKSYVGIQFKKGNLTYGSGGSKNTVKEVRNQAEEAFEKEIHDLENKSVGYIGRFIVAVTGEINEPARTFIGRARQKGLDRRIDYWNGDRLAEYIQTHWHDEFIQYFNIKLNEEIYEENQIVDEQYIVENYSDLVKKCIDVKSTINSFQFDMLTSLVKLQVISNFLSGVPIADFLLEVGRTEDYINDDLRLMHKLNYIDFDENRLFINGHATNLASLLENILEELIYAEEDENSAFEVFINILK